MTAVPQATVSGSTAAARVRAGVRARAGAAAAADPAASADHPAGQAASTISLHGVPVARAQTLEVRLPGGRRQLIPLAVAVGQGLVVQGADGNIRVTLAGRMADVRLAAPPHARARLAQEPSDKDAPKPASATLAEVGRAAMFASGALKIAKGPGMPSPLTLYFFANGANHYAGGKLLPAWMKKGPVRDLIDFSLIGKMWHASWKALPSANRHFRTAAQQSSGGVGLLKAAFSKLPSEGVADAAAGAAREANVPALKKLFPLIKPLTKLGFTMYAGAAILELPEYLRKNGTKGLLSTRSGRGALLGALDGVMMLPVLHLPSSPAVAWADFISNSAWLLGLINGKGWLDPLFGGDPPKPEDAAAKTVGKRAENTTARIPTTAAAAQQATMLAQAAVGVSQAAARISAAEHVPASGRRRSRRRR